MEPKSEGMRDRLLSRLPQPENLADYRKEVAALLQKNEKGLRIQKWYAGVVWCFVVMLGTVFFVLVAQHPDKPKAVWQAAYLGSFACFFLIFGAVELLKLFINNARVEMLKETKQVQLQVLELQDLLRKGSL
jgi:hypothetical protein